jgi:hypothetical protein
MFVMNAPLRSQDIRAASAKSKSISRDVHPAAMATSLIGIAVIMAVALSIFAAHLT